MRDEAQFADMLRQAVLLRHHVLDGMRPARQLGEQEDNNEQEMAQGIHGICLIGLDEQAFEVFTFRKVQRHRVVRRP